MERVLKALADTTRLRILGLLLTGEVCVCHIHESLRISQPKASRHLAYLRRAGIVDARRDGKWIHYSLARPDDEMLARVLDTTLNVIADERQMKRDRLALERACCAVRLPAALQNAPKPQLGVRA